MGRTRYAMTIWGVSVPAGLSSRSALLDAGIGVVALALSLVFGSQAAVSQPGTRPLDALGYALVVTSCAAVMARRVAPVPVLGVVVTALAVFAVLDYPGGPLLIPVVVAAYSVGTALERPAVLAVGALVTVIVVVRAWLSAAQAHGPVSAFTWAAPGWVLASLAWGAAVRSRRQLLESARLRAELAERTREAEAERRADQERLRIARDLHDVIGHSFSAVVMDGGAIAVEIANDGVTQTAISRSRAVSPDGHGLAGMRERVTALGGSLRASPDGGGFKVTGIVPVGGRRP